jgi:hypothetical protein
MEVADGKSFMTRTMFASQLEVTMKPSARISLPTAPGHGEATSVTLWIRKAVVLEVMVA